MQEHRTLISRRGIIGLAIIIAVLVAPAYALLSNAPTRPAVVAFMNLKEVFDNLDMRKEAEVEIRDLETRMMEKLKAKTEEVEMLQENAENYEKGSSKYMEAMQTGLDAASRMRAYNDFITIKIDAMMADQRIQIYDEIISAATEFAEQHGIDFIITNDAAIELQAGTDMQIMQQMTTRRIVYANDSLDITDELVQWINTR